MSTSPICPPKSLLDGLQTLAVANGWELKLTELHFMFWTHEDLVAVSCDAEPESAICVYKEVPPSNEVFAHEYSQNLGLQASDPDRKHDDG